MGDVFTVDAGSSGSSETVAGGVLTGALAETVARGTAGAVNTSPTMADRVGLGLASTSMRCTGTVALAPGPGAMMYWVAALLPPTGAGSPVSVSRRRAIA